MVNVLDLIDESTRIFSGFDKEKDDSRVRLQKPRNEEYDFRNLYSLGIQDSESVKKRELPDKELTSLYSFDFNSNSSPKRRKKRGRSLEEIVLELDDPNSLAGRLSGIYKSALEDNLKDDKYIFKNNYIINKNYKENYKEKLNLYNLKEKFDKIIEPIKYENKESLDSLLRYYTGLGYETTRKDISPDIPEEPQIGLPQEPVEVTRQGLPEEYQPILEVLAKEHPGIRYVSMTRKTKTQHNVDVLEFEYKENGKIRRIGIVLKDRSEIEEAVPLFLRRLGIPMFGTYGTATTQFSMEEVGEKDLRDFVKNASESDVVKASTSALDVISQIHVAATAHLSELGREYNIQLPVRDYVYEFKSRFLEPVSGHSVIISPQMHRLMQAYSAFAKTFNPDSFIHGDYHTTNCRISADYEAHPIDWETAALGKEFDDVSRHVNAVSRDRPDMDAADFSREMLMQYVEKHNEHAEQEKTPLMLHNERLASVFRNSLINDEIYKIGEYIAFGALHPDTKEEKMQKSQDCFERSIRMLDSAIKEADKQREYYEWETLTNLRGALVDYTTTSPIQTLREIAEKYKAPTGYVKELILIPAA